MAASRQAMPASLRTVRKSRLPATHAQRSNAGVHAPEYRYGIDHDVRGAHVGRGSARDLASRWRRPRAVSQAAPSANEARAVPVRPAREGLGERRARRGNRGRHMATGCGPRGDRTAARRRAQCGDEPCARGRDATPRTPARPPFAQRAELSERALAADDRSCTDERASPHARTRHPRRDRIPPRAHDSGRFRSESPLPGSALGKRCGGWLARRDQHRDRVRRGVRSAFRLTAFGRRYMRPPTRRPPRRRRASTPDPSYEPAASGSRFACHERSAGVSNRSRHSPTVGTVRSNTWVLRRTAPSAASSLNSSRDTATIGPAGSR